MANDFNFCKMVNKQVEQPKDALNNNIINNLDDNYVNTNKTSILNLIFIINIIILAIFVLLFVINLYRYILNINNYMFIFLVSSLIFGISLIITGYLFIKSRK